jgi:hypothetical protein
VKTSFFHILIPILILISCTEDDTSNLTGEWDIMFSVTAGSDSYEAFGGTLTLEDNKNQLSGIIVIDIEGLFVYAELLPGGSVSRTYNLLFESYVWLTNDSISTLTLTYSGTVNNTCDFMEGIFTSGSTKIGDWAATKK